jgi:signal recognition particle GTPase
MYEELNTKFPNNEQQDHIYKVIMNAVQYPSKAPERNLYFIHGLGGTGKTTLCKKLFAAIRALGKIVKVMINTLQHKLNMYIH